MVWRYGRNIVVIMINWSDNSYLKARNYGRLKLLYSQREEIHKDKLVIISLVPCYYPVFFKYLRIFFREIMSFHAVQGSQKFLIIMFKVLKKGKDILVGTKMPSLKTDKGSCGR